MSKTSKLQKLHLQMILYMFIKVVKHNILYIIILLYNKSIIKSIHNINMDIISG